MSCLHLWRNRVEGACWHCHLRRLIADTARAAGIRRHPAGRQR